MAENGFVNAYQFELEAGPARITYHEATRRLHYVGPSKPHLDDVVEVDQTVSPLHTSIGRLVSAILAFESDRVDSTVSVLLPEVHLEVAEADMGKGPAASAIDFETVAVWTDSFSTEGGVSQVRGVVHRYMPVDSHGTALAPYVFVSVQTARPGRPAVLVVEGGCTLGSSGYEVSLVRHEPQGAVAEDLLLDLVLKEPGPDAEVLPVLTTYPVRYEEESDVLFETVTILPDGPSVRVKHVS